MACEAWPEDGVRGVAALLLDVRQQPGLQGLFVHQAEQAGVGAQYLELLAIDILHTGDLAGKEEAEQHERYPQGAPDRCRHHPGQYKHEAERIGTAYHVGQDAQQGTAAEEGGADGPGLQFGFVGALPFVQQAQDAEALAEVGEGGQFLHGGLPGFYLFLVLQVLAQPGGQPGSSGLRAGAVEAGEERARPIDIEVEGVEMRRVDVFLAVIEGGGIQVQRGQFLPVDFGLLLQIVLAAEQAVVVLDEGEERQHRHGQCAAPCPPAVMTQGDGCRDASHEEDDAQQADAVYLLLYLVLAFFCLLRPLAVVVGDFSLHKW